MRRWATVVLAGVALSGGASASPLTVTRAVRVVSDTLNGPAPRIVPGTVVDYEITGTNQTDTLSTPVRDILIEETVPATVRMSVAALGANGSPVEYADGSLLGTGLLPSGATFGFTSLASQTDGLDFSNGSAWGYVPRPDADGYDPAVRAIRVKLGGAQLAGRTFRLRYRALVP